MRKLICILVCTAFTISCSKKEEVNDLINKSPQKAENKVIAKAFGEENQDVSTIKLKAENKVIAKAFGFFSIEENQDVSTIKLVQDNRVLSKKGYKIMPNSKSKRVVYAIPFSEDNSKFLLTDGAEKEFILDIKVDKEGNGSVSLISVYSKTVKRFKDTELIDVTNFTRVGEISNNLLELEDSWRTVDLTTAKRKTYKKCFDEAYTSICDDFIGCLAWHTHPLVPITAAVYCLF